MEDVSLIEQQMKKMNQHEVEIIKADRSKKDIASPPGSYIGVFGNLLDYRNKEYLDTLADILSHAQALDMVSPVFDLLSIPNHAHLAQ